MGKLQVVSVPQFMTSGFPPSETMVHRVSKHIRKHQKTYIAVGSITVSILIMGAADPNAVTAVTGPQGIDIKAHQIYSRLCLIGKWIIAIKGGVEIVSCMSQGEIDTMKKKVLGYLVGYLALLGLPWLLDQASLLFDGTNT